MRSTGQRVALLALAGLSAFGWDGVRAVASGSTRPHAQGARDAARSESETGLTLSAEAFCNPPRRTSNMRLRWGLSPAARSAIRLTTFSTARQTLETTVYVNGFEKGLYVSLAVPSGQERPPVAAAAPATAQAAQLRQALPRSFQIRLVESGAPAADSAEFGAIDENVEPGLNYTWRLTIEGPAGKLVSAPVEVQAVTCPVDGDEAMRSPARDVASEVTPNAPPKRRP